MIVILGIYGPNNNYTSWKGSYYIKKKKFYRLAARWIMEIQVGIGLGPNKMFPDHSAIL